MKYVLSLFFISLCFSLAGCAKESESSLCEPVGSTGKVSLHFDKINTPANVAVVTATLSRTGYATINGTLNLLSDTSATIFISNVAQGGWHLLVQAFDQSNTVVYKGETDVTIITGNVTQVSLVLQPIQFIIRYSVANNCKNDVACEYVKEIITKKIPIV